MKQSFKLLFCIIPLILSSCAELQQTSKNIQQVLASISGSTSASQSSSSKQLTSKLANQICKTYEENEVKALEYYDNKVTFKAKAISISYAGYAGVSFKIGSANVLYVIQDLEAVANLKKGKSYTASGEIRLINPPSELLSSKCDIIILGNSIK